MANLKNKRSGELPGEKTGRSKVERLMDILFSEFRPEQYHSVAFTGGEGFDELYPALEMIKNMTGNEDFTFSIKQDVIFKKGCIQRIPEKLALFGWVLIYIKSTQPKGVTLKNTNE